MKAISIQQPWAEAVILGYKDVENRTWATNHFGPLMIHAAKKFDQMGYEFIIDQFPHLEFPKPKEMKMGGVIGVVDMVGVVVEHDSPWFFGPYGFLFKNPKRVMFRPVPVWAIRLI